MANLRFLFETCINTRLLQSEEGYKYKLRYSIYAHQLGKADSLLEFSEVDRTRLRKLANDEAHLTVKGGDPNEVMEKFRKVGELYDDLENEISVLLDLAEWYGAELYEPILDDFLQQQMQRKNEISAEWEIQKKAFAKDPEVNRLFGLNGQASKVEQALRDLRTWKEKATTVGLGDLYKFLYNYTSSIIHSTSYSLLLPSQLHEAEKTMIVGLAGKLAHDGLLNLCKFSKVPDFHVLEV